jgi:hypothetical protein
MRPRLQVGKQDNYPLHCQSVWLLALLSMYILPERITFKPKKDSSAVFKYGMGQGHFGTNARQTTLDNTRTILYYSNKNLSVYVTNVY